jgi:TolB protein
MTTLLISSILFVTGIGLLGGAMFGRIRARRFILLSLALVAWILAGCAVFSGDNETAPTPAPTQRAVATATPETKPVPTATPEPVPTATPAPAAAQPGTSPLPTPQLPEPETISPAEPTSGQLVFASTRSGNFDLWVMDLAQPDTPRQLTQSAAADVEPRWAPDGSKIVFSSNEDRPYNDIFVISSDGSDRQRLLDWPGTHEWGASWSPDGQKIAFTSERDGNYQIYILFMDGKTDPINLMQDNYFYTYPDWSADGQWLVFSSDRSGHWDIWKVNVAECLESRLSGQGDFEACQPQQLTTNPDDDFFPRWSPDGSHIALSSRRNANRDIYIIDADGNNATRITTAASNDSNPIWALNGETLIISRRLQTEWDLFMVNSDGSDMRQLTNSPGEDRFGDWRP